MSQQQTFGDFETIISVDGGDLETAAVCRPFLSDPRFRMVVHSERLDWFGNFNWLLQQPLNEFFCDRQTTIPPRLSFSKFFSEQPMPGPTPRPSMPIANGWAAVAM